MRRPAIRITVYRHGLLTELVQSLYNTHGDFTPVGYEYFANGFHP